MEIRSPQPQPGKGEVHAWLFDLQAMRMEAHLWREVLSAEEMQRADRFHFKADRQRFITRRGLLRYLLGGYTGLPPAELSLSANDQGKPSLTGQTLKFNISTCQEWVVYVFASQMEVGVDLEAVRPFEERQQMVKRIFSASEQRELAALDASQQLDGFYHLWTRKEAWLKACGTGMSFPLHGFSVSASLSQADATGPESQGGGCTSGWQIHSCSPSPGWKLAVCAEEQAGFQLIWRSPGPEDPPLLQEASLMPAP